MAYNLINNDVIQVVLNQRQAGQRVMNVLHYRAVLPPEGAPYDGESALTGLSNKLQEALGLINAMKAAQSNLITYESIQLQIVHPTRRPYLRLPLGGQGDQVTKSLPVNSAAVVTKQSTLAGRGRAGSFHLAGVPEIAAVNSLLTLAYKTLLEDVADDIEASLTVIPGGTVSWTARPLLWSGPEDGSGNEIHDVYVNDEVRVMRRRTVGLGI